MAISYEGFYEGEVTSFNPDYGNFKGYRMSAAQLGFPGSPQTANQLGEAINAAKQGAKAFEIQLLQPDLANTIPKRHFSEIRALMKLTGVKPSVHGPLIDAAGFDEKGNWGNGFGREDAERRMFDTMEKAAMLDNKGSVPVVFHSSAGAPGSEFRPGKKEWEEEEFVMQRGAMINKETGAAQLIKREYKFRPERPDLLKNGVAQSSAGGEPAGVLFSAEDSVSSANNAEWENTLMEVAQMNKHAEEIIGSAPKDLEEYKDAVITKKGIFKMDDNGNFVEKLPGFDRGSNQEKSYKQMYKASLFLENAELSFNSAFHKAYKYGTDNQRKQLKELSEYYSNKSKTFNSKVLNPVDRHNLLDECLSSLQSITYRKSPEIFQESNSFALDKAAETFGNLAEKSYNNLGGNKAPVLAIEPFHPNAGLSSTNDMIKLVKKSRDNFAKQLVSENGFSRKEAKRIAEEKIGVTWDVGHINMIKKYGFTDKDIIKQTKKIAPMVKHVHLTDNFGFADTHLAPGMGNVPIKKIMEQLEKNGEFDKMRKIVEAGAFVQHFKTSPHPLSMAAFGSPIYGMKVGPGWNQAHHVQGMYSGGYGMINPQIHHSYFGAGFTTMPVELGGNMPGGDSRFGGTPMA